MFDKLGVSHQTVNAMMSYAYHIDLTEDILLSLGLSGGLYNNNWDPRKNSFSEENEDLLDEKSSRTAADFDTGLELSGYGFIFGMSLTHLLNSSPERSYTGKPGREIYGYLRYRGAIDRDFDIAPCIMYRNGNHSHFFDINVTGFYLKKYWAGISLRPQNSFAIMLGGEYNIYRIGYAYDRCVGAVSSLAANTHEIMLSVRLQKPQQGKKTTRFLD
jgi:type IX secretion system PorP/SprF family membrane protein